MPSILHVNASPNGAGSHSLQAGKLLAARLAQTSSPTLIERDISLLPPHAINREFVEASLMREDARHHAQRQALVLSEQLIAELEACDCLILSTPMHNFTVPAALKVWLDLVMRPDRTFRGGPDGKNGLLNNRPVFVIVASGGPMQSKPDWQPDFLTPYLRCALATIGLSDVSILQLESLKRGDKALLAAAQATEQWVERQSRRYAAAAAYRATA